MNPKIAQPLAVDRRWWATARVRQDAPTPATPKSVSLQDGVPMRRGGSATNRDGVAVIAIDGPLSARDSLFSMLFGGTSYDDIAKSLGSALDNPEVNSIAMSINSPGGELAGAGELASYIAAARGKKPIVAYVEGYAASAAYYIASAADRIVAAPSALLGSIGVLIDLVDYSKMEESVGITTQTIVSTQSPDKLVDPSDPDDIERVQRMVDDLAAVFVTDVATYRGVTEQKVIADFGRGDVLVGLAAVRAGLADEIGTFEAVHAGLVRKGQEMAMNEKLRAALGLDATASDDDAIGKVQALKAHSEAQAQREQAMLGEQKQLLAATGTSTLPAALGVIEAWKVSASRADELAAAAATNAQAKVEADFAALVEDGRKSRKLSPAQIATFVPTMKRDGKASAESVSMLRAYLDAAHPLGQDDATAAKPPPPPAASALTAEEAHVAKLLGNDPAAVAKLKQRAA